MKFSLWRPSDLIEKGYELIHQEFYRQRQKTEVERLLKRERKYSPRYEYVLVKARLPDVPRGLPTLEIWRKKK